MTSPTRKPTYNAEEFDYDDISESSFGHILHENEVDIEEVKFTIRVLSEKSAHAVWTLTFGDANHKAEITEDNWTSLLSWTSSGDWIPYFNQGNCEVVEQQLRELVDWSIEQAVLFLKGPCECVLTNWGTFLQNWHSFFEYDDDGPFVIPVDGTTVLRISPNGTILKGVPRQVQKFKPPNRTET